MRILNLFFALGLLYTTSNAQGILKPSHYHEEPLILLDSLEVDLNLLFLDPNSIESIDVLKAPKSVAAYGDRGKNGVVHIKPKLNIQLLQLTQVFDLYNISPADRTLAVRIDNRDVESGKNVWIDKAVISDVNITNTLTESSGTKKNERKISIHTTGTPLMNQNRDHKPIVVQEKLLRHVVLFKFKDGTSVDDIKKVEDAFKNLPSQIKEISDFEFGKNNSPENLNQGFTHCFFVTFKSEKDREVYLPHPAHKKFVSVLQPHLDKALVIDYWAGK